MQLPGHQKLDDSPEFFSHKSLGQAPDGKYFQSLHPGPGVEAVTSR